MTTSTQPSRPRWEPHFLRLSRLADRFLPEGVTDPESVRSKRTVVLGAIVGFFFANATAASYWGYGSSWSAGAITLISVGLLTVPVLVRRGASTATIGHVMTALTAQAALVVASRSGGLDSPAVAWFFMLPVISYLACGYSGSLGWAAAALLAIVGLFAADRAGIDFAQDFTADTLSILRVSGYPGVIISTAILMMMVESVRLASLEERDRAASALERERLLRDMHDGVGGHLMGLIVRVRSHQLSEPALLHGLEACLNDVGWWLIASTRPSAHSSWRLASCANARCCSAKRPVCDLTGSAMAPTRSCSRPTRPSRCCAPYKRCSRMRFVTPTPSALR